jgi:hypothetical protein
MFVVFDLRSCIAELFRFAKHDLKGVLKCLQVKTCTPFLYYRRDRQHHEELLHDAYTTRTINGVLDRLFVMIKHISVIFDMINSLLFTILRPEFFTVYFSLALLPFLSASPSKMCVRRHDTCGNKISYMPRCFDALVNIFLPYHSLHEERKKKKK